MALQRRVRELERCSASSEELKVVREKCETHEKEKRAILTIMEQKIKTLVENAVLAARSVVVDSSSGVSSNARQGQRLRQELHALQRLMHVVDLL